VTLSELNLVRVVFIEGDRAFTGSEGVARAPRIGDVGAVVHAHSADVFAVECVDADGHTLWLADLHIGEIAPVLDVATLFPAFLPELEELMRAVGRPDLFERLRSARVFSRCACGDANCAHFYTAPQPSAAGGRPENLLLPSQSGLIALDIVNGEVTAVEVLDRPDLQVILDRYLPGRSPTG
jgi:hypothetical protein